MILVVTGLVAWPIGATAQEENRGRDNAERGAAARQRILRAFDKDGDGRLNEAERDAVREQLGERFEAVRERIQGLFDVSNDDRDDDEDQGDDDRRDGRGRARGGRDAERNRDAERSGRGRGERPEADGERGPEAGRRSDRRAGREGDRDEQVDGRRRDGAGPDRPDRERERPVRPERPPGTPDAGRPFGPRGPMGPGVGRRPRDLESLFGWFDMDGDDQLSRGEFAELAQFVERRGPRVAGGPPAGPRFGQPAVRGFRALDRSRPDAAPTDRIRRFEGPPGGDRPDRDYAGDRPRDRGRPPRPPRPDGPPEPGPGPDGPDLTPRDA